MADRLFAAVHNRAARVTMRPRSARSMLMLDVVYILMGAAFLGGCVLYAVACDHL
jgi:hypothetical protein